MAHNLRNSRVSSWYLIKVEFLDCRLDWEGLHPTDKKFAPISEAPSPKNVVKLCSYLGLLNYYRHFIPDLSTLLQP